MTTALKTKALLSMLAASAVAMATPALAQNVGLTLSYGSPGYGYGQGYGYEQGRGYDNRAERLGERIDHAAYNGRISRREAQNLRWQLAEYHRLEWRYRRDGLSRWEREDLNQRLDRIRYELREDRRDGGRRDRW